MNRGTAISVDANVSEACIEKLLSLAVEGLRPMYHPDSQLFCHRRRLSPNGLVNEGLSQRYTMMTLLGLARREASGHPIPFDVRSVLARLLTTSGQIRNLGDLGLLLWLCGEIAPDSIPDAGRGLDIRNALRCWKQARERRTMELSWLLAGLTHARLSSPSDTSHLTDAAFEAYRLLGKNQGLSGIFGHTARGRSLAGLFRGHIGSFADQVYPIYALARFGRALEVGRAVEMARHCGEAICRMQGPAGQWWWHYDSRKGRVFEKYPAYSVHQHGMAPMALFELGAATGIDYSDAIHRGLRWVSETNELGTDLCDEERHLIWRCIYQGSRWKTYADRVLRVMGREVRAVPMDRLLVRLECRPYELGWLLYAFAGRQSGMSAPPLSSTSASGRTPIQK